MTAAVADFAAPVAPTSPWTATGAFLRLDLLDSLRSRWVAFTAVVYVCVLGAFVWLGLRESSVLGFTGLSRVVLNLANAVAVALPLVALVATSQAIVKPRTTGFYELFLSLPCRRTEWFRAVVLSRVVVIVGPLVILLLGTWAYGALDGEASIGPIVARTLVVTATLAFAFIGIGLWVSSVANTPERAMVFALAVWLTATALHDFALIGVLLQTRLTPQVVFALAALNPVETARLAVLSGVDPELSVLGPVGFWLANTLGPSKMFLLGTCWPAALGALAMWRASARVGRMDLVG
jgi:ABC-2 type transport system permease protein